MIKTILYTICKNEENRIERWLNCYKNVDEIVVLDTGSTDRSIELLRKDPRVHLIEKTWDLFNFGEARNIALEEAWKVTDREPNTNWIFLCFDLDEYLEENGIKKIKEEWAVDSYENAVVYFTSPSDESPVPHYSRVHNKNKNWVWEGVIHEGIRLRETSGSEKTLQSKVTYYHDRVESCEKQAFYEYLIKKWESILTKDIHLKNYLIDIYFSKKEKEKCLEVCDKLIELTKNNLDDFDYYLTYFHALYTRSRLEPGEELEDLLKLDNLAETYKDGQYASKKIKIKLGMYYLSRTRFISINRNEGRQYLEEALQMDYNSSYYYPFVDSTPVTNIVL